MKGKRVFVTGAARGIGKSITTAFIKAGANVAFCDKDLIAGKEVARDT